jgi:hypothetical protein
MVIHGAVSSSQPQKGTQMGQSDEAWNDVGEQLKSLGVMFKSHYQAYEGEDITEVVSDDEVKDALRTLGESAKAAFGTIGDAFADAEIREEARQTAGSFFDALGATFSELGDDISTRRESNDTSVQPSPENATYEDVSELDE